jgi:hypothetical protein
MAIKESELNHARRMIAYYDHKIGDLKSQIEVAKVNLKDCRRVHRTWKQRIATFSKEKAP